MEKTCLLSIFKFLHHFTLSNGESWQTLELNSNWDLNTKWRQISFQHFQTTYKFKKHIKNTSLHLFKVLALLMMTTRRYHFQNKLTFKLKLKFQILISLPIHIQMAWIFFHRCILLWCISAQTYRSIKVQMKKIWSKNNLWSKIFKTPWLSQNKFVFFEFCKWKCPIILYNLSKFHFKILRH